MLLCQHMRWWIEREYCDSNTMAGELKWCKFAICLFVSIFIRLTESPIRVACVFVCEQHNTSQTKNYIKGSPIIICPWKGMVTTKWECYSKTWHFSFSLVRAQFFNIEITFSHKSESFNYVFSSSFLNFCNIPRSFYWAAQTIRFAYTKRRIFLIRMS